VVIRFEKLEVILTIGWYPFRSFLIKKLAPLVPGTLDAMRFGRSDL
jgi:hypothetical protein